VSSSSAVEENSIPGTQITFTAGTSSQAAFRVEELETAAHDVPSVTTQSRNDVTVVVVSKSVQSDTAPPWMLTGETRGDLLEMIGDPHPVDASQASVFDRLVEAQVLAGKSLTDGTELRGQRAPPLHFAMQPNRHLLIGSRRCGPATDKEATLGRRRAPGG